MRRWCDSCSLFDVFGECQKKMEQHDIRCGSGPGSKSSVSSLSPISTPNQASSCQLASQDSSQSHTWQEPVTLGKFQRSLSHIGRSCQELQRSVTQSLFSMSRKTSEKEGEEVMAGVTLRSKRVLNTAQSLPTVGLSDDWKKRLTDYQFLCGKEEEPMKRRRSLFCRESTKNHRRHSLRHARNKDVMHS